jgi:hypothetical protein
MTTQEIIFAIAIATIFVIAVMWGRRGPRVTQIDRTIERDKEDLDDA